jgi:hypothetical protein
MSNAVEKYDELAPVVSSETTAIVQMIERAAANPAVDIDKMERLLQMQERVMDRRAKAAFDSALAIMQPSLPQVDRNGRIVVFSKADRDKAGGPRPTDTPLQSTPYALWEDINAAIGPHLAEHGFALSFRTGQAADGKITVTAVLSHKEGHREETTITLMHDSGGSKNSVQAVGSSISYGKRYTAGLLLNITSRAPGDADDDGVKAGAPSQITAEQLAELRASLVSVGGDVAGNERRFCDYFGIENISDLPANDFARAVKAIRAKEGSKHG